MRKIVFFVSLLLIACDSSSQIPIQYGIISSSRELEFFSSEGNVLLDYPREYGYEYTAYPLAGDFFISTVDADKNVTSKMRHNDQWPPRITTDPGVSIIIVGEGGAERSYSPDDPLPEYQPGIVNEFFFIRDDSDDPATSIYILIIHP